MNEEKRTLRDELNRLIEITTHKKQRLQVLHNMTRMQSAAIEQKDIDLLTGYIGEKQRHIDAIDELDQKFLSIYNEEIKAELDSGLFKDRNPEERQLFERLRDEISLIQDIIKEIYDLEKENSQKAKELMEDLKQRIRHIKTGKKGYSAYNKAYSYSDGIYIDQKK
ncbi:MAG: flagellar export chaperone FlgN [Caldicoprobacterales bacterium]|jgi:hypothetical protein|nr:hypothetical protein [Clostridiales bacterium]